MKKITLLFALATFLSFSLKAQISISVDATETWNAYVNAFDLSDNFATGFGYDIALLRTDVDPVGQTVTVFPNFKIWDDNDDTPGTGEFDAEWNPYWFSSPGVPAKKVELNSYVQKDKTNDPDLFTQDVTFSGDINSFGLTEPGYVVKVFIKVFVGDFSSNRQYDEVITGPGTFSVTAPGVDFTAGDQFIQWGFQHYGPIADDALEPARAPQAFGGIEFQDPALSTNKFELADFNVSPNPSNNVWNIKAQQTIDNIQVFDVLGKQVMTVKPNNTDVELNANTLPKGLYFAKMSTEYGANTIKLIKN